MSVLVALTWLSFCRPWEYSRRAGRIFLFFEQDFYCKRFFFVGGGRNDRLRILPELGAPSPLPPTSRAHELFSYLTPDAAEAKRRDFWNVFISRF